MLGKFVRNCLQQEHENLKRKNIHSESLLLRKTGRKLLIIPSIESNRIKIIFRIIEDVVSPPRMNLRTSRKDTREARKGRAATHPKRHCPKRASVPRGALSRSMSPFRSTSLRANFGLPGRSWIASAKKQRCPCTTLWRARSRLYRSRFF